MISRCLLLLCLLLTSAFPEGRAQHITFQHMTVEDGLSHNAVLAVVQDHQGFTWYGTRYGLNRYDGRRFKIYRHHPDDSTSLPDNQVMALFRDRHNTLWVGTSGGLAWYDPANDRFERMQLLAGRQTNVNCIYEDSKGRLWVGGNNGLYLRENNGFRFITPPSIAGYVVRCVYEDREGNTWIGTNNGLTRFNSKDTTLFRHEEGNAASLSMNFVTTVTEDAAGKLWIGTQTGGINIYDPGSRTFSALSQPGIVNNIVRRIVRDKNGRMWIGTQEGLSIVDPVTMANQNYQHEPGNTESLSQNSIHSIYLDHTGSMWLGTYFGGVNMVHPYGTAFTSWPARPNGSGLSNNVISRIIEDAQHNLWMGTEGGGLNHYNRQTGHFTYYKHDPANPASIGSNLVKVVYEDKDRHIWAGTHGGGLNLLLPNGSFRRYFYNNGDPGTFSREVTALLEDDQGRFWVGTNDRLHIMHRYGNELVKEKDSALAGPVEKFSVRCIFQDSRQRVFVGTISGLFVLEGSVMRLLRPGYINSIEEDSKHHIWVSMYFGGLLKYDAGLQNAVHYTEKNGLPNSNVLGLLEDAQQKLWISTDNGLVKLDPQRNTMQVYTTSDGIAGNVFNYNSFLEDSKGEFYFGGYNGITSFFPGNILTNTQAAPLLFTGLRLFNAPVSIGGNDGLLTRDMSQTKALHFRHDQEVFTLEFALLNFVKSGKNRYAYRLEGADRGWIETDNPAVTYTNLSSGHYTFWVKGANNDGVWSKPVAMEITILPPFWRTWWAYCLYALLLGLLFFMISRFFFLRALLRKEEELHQVKLNFFTHVSHEIRTHLTLLMAPVEKMTDSLKKDDPLQSSLSQLRNNADRLLKLVSELMDFRKAETHHLKLHVGEQDLVPFLNNIYTSFRQQSLDRQISISFTHDTEQAPLYFDREQLEKVFFNLLGNAFKFTPNGGRIQLHLARQRNTVVITVTDNGRGIAPEYLGKLFTNFFQVQDHGVQNTGYGIGLALSRNIVEQHKGALTVESEPAAGVKEGHTCFTVTLLQGVKHFEGTQHVVDGATAEPAFDAHAALQEGPATAKASGTASPPDTMPVSLQVTGVQESTMDKTTQQSPSAKPARQPLANSESGPNETIDPAITGAGAQAPTSTVGQEQEAAAETPFTIHIVEDNAELRALIRDTFAGHYHILESSNGAEGLETATAQIPDLVISDVMMPGMDGLQFCQVLKTDQRTSHIPVVLLTAKSSQADHVSGLETGADLYLTKPFSTKVLQLNVRNLLASREKMRERFGRQLHTGATPLAINGAMPNSIDTAFLDRVIALTDEHMDNPEFGVDMLAKKVAMSQPVLYKKLKALTGMSVNDFIKSLRLKKAAELIRSRQYTVYQVSYMVGYNDSKYFSKEFKKQFGKTPSAFAGEPEL